MESAWVKGLYANLIVIAANLVWTGATSLIIFMTLQCIGWLRVEKDEQEKGLDRATHCPEKAYIVNIVDY